MQSDPHRRTGQAAEGFLPCTGRWGITHKASGSPSLQPFCGLVWPSGGRFWDLRLAGLERMNHPPEPGSRGHVVFAPHLTPGLTHPSTFTPQGQGWAHKLPPAPSECGPGAGYRARCPCILHSGPRKGLRR